MNVSPGWDVIIEDWRATAPWDEPEHVVQDLVLSRLILEIANDKRLRRRLVLHGGTCLHKIWHNTPLRYSEDLDFLCTNPRHLPFVMRRVKQIMRHAGLSDARYSFWGYPSIAASEVDGRAVDLKVDFNPTLEAARRAFRNRSSRGSLTVDTDWYRGQTTLIPCASPTDILASKIAAVMTRAKPRDLADLCTGFAAGLSDVDSAVAAYHEHYRRHSHPTTLKSRVDLLLADETYRAGLAGGTDYQPAPLTDDSVLAAAAQIDNSIAKRRSAT